MLIDNIIIFGFAGLYMLAVAAFAIVCVYAFRWAATKLEDMLG